MVHNGFWKSCHYILIPESRKDEGGREKKCSLPVSHQLPYLAAFSEISKQQFRLHLPCQNLIMWPYHVLYIKYIKFINWFHRVCLRKKGRMGASRLCTHFFPRGTLGLSLLGEEDNLELSCSLFVSLTRKHFFTLLKCPHDAPVLLTK